MEADKGRGVLTPGDLERHPNVARRRTPPESSDFPTTAIDNFTEERRTFWSSRCEGHSSAFNDHYGTPQTRNEPCLVLFVGLVSHSKRAFSSCQSRAESGVVTMDEAR